MNASLSCECNGKKLVPSSQDSKESIFVDSYDTESEDDEPEDDEPEVDEACKYYKKLFYCAGSVFSQYQDSLIYLRSCQNPSIRLFFETDNVEDCNAIAFQVLIDDIWCTFGYIQMIYIPMVTKAIKSSQVTNVCKNSIRWTYIKPANSYFYRAKCVVIKKGKWGKEEDRYTYNCDLSKF